MPIERKKGVSVWKQIQQALAGEIVTGILKPGERLPTETALSERFGVNRHTLRRALSELEQMDMIRIEHGRGMFVREQIVDYNVGRRTRFSENLSKLKRTPGGVLLSAQTMPADEVPAEALGIAPGRPVAVLDRAGEADGHRISVSTHYLSEDRFPGVTEVYIQTKSITRTLEHFGVGDYERKVTRVTARMPTARDARILDQPRNRPILMTEGVNTTRDGEPVEYCVTRFASDWVQIVFEP